MQSELEAAAGMQSALAKRVATQLLDVSLSASRRAAFGRPIAQASSEFVSNLAQGVAAVIVAVPYLLPWGIVLGVRVWAGRRWWRRGRRPARGATTASRP